MNQILQVKNTKRQFKQIDNKMVILYLIIAIIILGLCVGGYYIYENINNGNVKLPIFIQVQKNVATITLTQTDTNKLTIKIQGETGISKVIYDINGEQAQVLEFLGETSIEETIEMPIGENVVFVSATDINGKETSKEESFIVEAPKPVIDLSVVGGNIKIKVTSEVELSEVTYKWNSDNEKKENMTTYQNKLDFEKQLEIPMGQNILTIVATDINGSKAQKIQEIKGITKATTITSVIGEYLHFTVTGRENIEKVEFEFNGQKYLMNIDTFGETKKVHYKVKLVEGMNYLKVISTTQSGGINTENFEQEYTR